MSIKEAKVVSASHSSACPRTGTAIPDSACQQLAATPSSGSSARELSQMASDKNQVMDELLNQDNIPTDYWTRMVALFRDKSQDILTRDFAVGDESAAHAVRVLAVHLCGERRIAAARASLSALADASSTPTPLRLAARNALGILANVGTL